MVGGIVADVLKMLLYGWDNRNLAQVGAEGLGERTGVVVGAVARAEARHGHGEHGVVGQLMLVAELGADDERQGGVKAAREAEHQTFRADLTEPPPQGLHLHLQDGAAPRGAFGRVFGDKGIFAQTCQATIGVGEVAQEREALLGWGRGRGGHALTVGADPRGGEVHKREAGGPLRFSQEAALPRTEAVAAVEAVGGGFAIARVGIDPRIAGGGREVTQRRAAAFVLAATLSFGIEAQDEIGVGRGGKAKGHGDSQVLKFEGRGHVERLGGEATHPRVALAELRFGDKSQDVVTFDEHRPIVEHAVERTWCAADEQDSFRQLVTEEVNRGFGLVK